MQKKFLIFCVTVTVFLLMTFATINANAAGNAKEIDISTSPHNVLFDIKNSKPGDSFTKKLKIHNKGTQSFNYLFSNVFLSGSTKLYNELLLTVTDENGQLFNGKLKDFQKLESRTLKVNNHEDLFLTVTFPYELGNDFQNQNSEFQFKFYVEGTLGGLLPVNGPKLPTTASQIFKLILPGTFFVLGGGALLAFSKRKKLDLSK